jgi:prepilin-type N-terminal cleavage/methylation domain-containing protein
MGARPVGPREHGFTLIETLICVAIIGLLAATAIPIYQGAMAKAHRAALAADMHELYSAFMRYHVDSGRFPDDVGGTAFNLDTIAPLSSSGYFRGTDALKGKMMNNRMWFYWAPDWEGPNSDFIAIARSTIDPSVYVYAMHYDFEDEFAYDGVYMLVNGQLVRADGKAI